MLFCDDFVVSEPEKLKGVETQRMKYVGEIDLASTVLELLQVQMVNNVQQLPAYQYAF